MEKAQKLYSSAVIILLGLIALFCSEIASPFGSGFAYLLIVGVVIIGTLSMWIADA